ncbi:methyl-accepting chemotaxis protein [Alteromonas mediterranea]|uniref:Methyl-accepting chemotaxis protein n=1 Tax=Alteromonas mediterranea 615 TaxID=1300253 RepID=S5A8G3_9ALTE|nr:methyl-accepting chemotaxis protein [Alteromonas mediterranea]AGP76592.1 methyl-accepting chemotaxis protein [Alteromonas mediterranea 615]AGP83985.1 methyl-accepting chemotaxis protein [Alteromonas mediterranea U4]AGP88057.1 methyl-accepting chemotaxis protein [Alteromonas mediterranea U7]AGP91942.1 methyl-accepting chemotaxis protein [Alteromonas mediterranea U8]
MQYPWLLEGHKIFRVVIVVQLVIASAIGVFTGELLPAFIFGVPIAAVPLMLSFQSPYSALSRHAMAIGVQLLTALHIHQSFGLIEVHFEIFVLLAFLSYFRDWKVIATGTAVVAVHHISFFFLQAGGAPLFIFEEGHISFSILLMHAAFALAEGGVLMYMAKQSHQEGAGAAELRLAIDNMQRSDGKLDLTVALNRQSNIVKPFAELIDQVKSLIELASNLTDDVVNGCNKMESAANNMFEISRNTDQELAMVSASSEEIAQTMQLSTEQTTLASDKASAAQTSSQSTRDSISNSSRTIESLRHTLNAAADTNSALNEQCSHISDAMRSITAVAEQTNLLALNAAIESARAGEHGRGFAVVADEVRTLAIRSKESADQITSITEQLVAQTASSVDQMQTCIQLVDEAVVSSDSATSAMTEIMQQIREASESMTEIATSAVEQETASASIAQSTARLSEFTSEELATAESLAEEVEVLSQVSKRMRSAIERFKL